MRRLISAYLFAILLLSTASVVQSIDHEAEKEIFSLLNQERTSRGLAALTWDDRLAEAARDHSKLMASRSKLSHQFSGEATVSKRLGATGVRFNYSGENVALDIDGPSAHDGLMHSPPHRANILKPEYTTVGIGVVRIGRQIWVTQDFARTFEEFSGTDAERKIAAQFNRLRKKSGAGELKVVPTDRLRDAACTMAKNDRLSTSAPRGISGVSNVVVFTLTDLTNLPNSLVSLKSKQASGMSVGVCFAGSRSYENPVYWSIVVLYF